MSQIETSVKECFKALLQAKPYEKITVSDICEAAHVSRRTFYKYYPNIESIVIAQIRDDFIAPVHETRRLLPVDEIKSSTALMIEATCNTMYNNRHYYAKLMHFKGPNSLAAAIAEEYYQLNSQIYADRIASVEEREFVAFLFSWMQPIALLWWVDEDRDTDPKTLAQLLNRWAFAYWRELDREKFAED